MIMVATKKAKPRTRRGNKKKTVEKDNTSFAEKKIIQKSHYVEGSKAKRGGDVGEAVLNSTRVMVG